MTHTDERWDGLSMKGRVSMYTFRRFLILTTIVGASLLWGMPAVQSQERRQARRDEWRRQWRDDRR